jgi:hypothetical protein
MRKLLVNHKPIGVRQIGKQKEPNKTMQILGNFLRMKEGGRIWPKDNWGWEWMVAFFV